MSRLALGEIAPFIVAASGPSSELADGVGKCLFRNQGSDRPHFSALIPECARSESAATADDKKISYFFEKTRKHLNADSVLTMDRGAD